MSRFIPLLSLALVALCATSPRAAKGRTVDRVVAVVNEEIILDSEVDQWASAQLQHAVNLSTAEGKKAWQEHKKKVLDQMVDSRLMSQQAAELKLSVTAEEVDRGIEELKRQNNIDQATFVEALKGQGFTLESYRKSMKKQILEMKVLNTAVRSRVAISDDEVKAYYDQNARQLSADKSAHLKQIFIAVAPTANADEVERKKRTAARMIELERDGKSFEELAKTYSDDAGTKADGGDLGWIGAGMLDEAIEQVVASMDPGETRGPIKTARGFHVLKLVERKAADVKPFEEAKEQLRKTLYDQAVEKAAQAWIKELRKKAHVDIR